jgi:hypothetical protein
MAVGDASSASFQSSTARRQFEQLQEPLPGRVRYLTSVRGAIDVRQAASTAHRRSNQFQSRPRLKEAKAMAKGATDFAQQNTERAMQATTYGMNWMREIAEQNLSQSKAALESVLMIARKAAKGMDQQAAVIRERSMFLAEETLLNTFDFAQRMVRMREPQEFAQLQGEFISRQAQVFGDQTKELGQSIVQAANDVAKTAHEEVAASPRRRSEAA